MTNSNGSSELIPWLTYGGHMDWDTRTWQTVTCTHRGLTHTRWTLKYDGPWHSKTGQHTQYKCKTTVYCTARTVSLLSVLQFAQVCACFVSTPDLSEIWIAVLLWQYYLNPRTYIAACIFAFYSYIPGANVSLLLV